MIKNIQQLNSMTKYPSILTYHNLGERGSLVNSLVENKKFQDDESVYVTEKIDGTNTRIILFTDAHSNIFDYFFGSREELLYAYRDRVCTDKSGITTACAKTLDRILDALWGTSPIGNRQSLLKPSSMYVFYGETYGGKINAYRQYTGNNTLGMRLFDAWRMPIDEAMHVLTLSIDQVASWRDAGNQPFVSVNEMQALMANLNLETVPYIQTIKGKEIPDDLQGVWDWMQQFSVSDATLDSEGKGQAEGVVLRNVDRTLIRKIRFEDYQKTKKRGLIR